MPLQIEKAKLVEKGAVCTLETVNRFAPREQQPLRAGTLVVYRGWALVADSVQPVPPLVYLMLRPEGAVNNAKDVYLEMGRMARPDVAPGEPSREMSGFEGEAPLPSRGKYEAFVSQGTPDWQTLCRTGSMINILE